MRPGVREIVTFHLFVEKEVNKGGDGRKRKAGKEGKREKGWFEERCYLKIDILSKKLHSFHSFVFFMKMKISMVESNNIYYHLKVIIKLQLLRF